VTAGVTLATDAISAAALSAAAIDEILDEAIGDGTVTMRQALRGQKHDGGGAAVGAAAAIAAVIGRVRGQPQPLTLTLTPSLPRARPPAPAHPPLRQRALALH
jgi:hypothetical protein